MERTYCRIAQFILGGFSWREEGAAQVIRGEIINSYRKPFKSREIMELAKLRPRAFCFRQLIEQFYRYVSTTFWSSHIKVLRRTLTQTSGVKWGTRKYFPYHRSPSPSSQTRLDTLELSLIAIVTIQDRSNTSFSSISALVKPRCKSEGLAVFWCNPFYRLARAMQRQALPRAY